jgi:hypothetical protein
LFTVILPTGHAAEGLTRQTFVGCEVRGLLTHVAQLGFHVVIMRVSHGVYSLFGSLSGSPETSKSDFLGLVTHLQQA